MTLDQGYQASDPAYRLQQLSMALLRDCRFLVALRLHTGQMTVQDAAQFIAREADFAPIRAQQEALRGVRAPGYLSYTLGKLLFQDLFRDLQQAHPDWPDLTLHNAVLGFGAPPLPLLRSILLPEGDAPC